jgi:predicted ATPase
MSKPFIRKLELKGLLSFGPENRPVDLTPLNVLIGPNAAGKSNFIEAFELLHATPTDFSEPIRLGGSAAEWLWKGVVPAKPATISTTLWSNDITPALLYRLVFTQC